MIGPAQERAAPALPGAPYAVTNSRGCVYYLHGKPVTLPNGTELSIYYFNRRVKRGETVPTLPAGYEVVEKVVNGLPYLRRASRMAAGTTRSTDAAPPVAEAAAGTDGGR
jgi:hypothetical protein